MDQGDPAREELEGLLQHIKLTVAKYMLKEYKLNYVDRENWKKVREAGTKHYKVEVGEFKKAERIMTKLRDKMGGRTHAEEEQLQHLETRLHHEAKRLNRGSFVQNIEERMADINQLFNDGDEKVALVYAKWLNDMLNTTFHGRDMRDYKGGKRKRRTRKVRHRQKRRRTRHKRRRRNRRRRRKYRTRRKCGGRL